MPSQTQPYIPDAPVDIHDMLLRLQQSNEFPAPNQKSWLDTLLEQLSPYYQKALDNFLQVSLRALEAFLRQFSGFLPKGTRAPSQEQLLQLMTYATIALGVLVGLLVIYIGYQLFQRWQRTQRKNSGTAVLMKETADGSLLISARFHLQAACEAASLQDFSGAIRQLFLSTLCLLDEHQLIAFETNRTNAEYQTRLSLLAVQENTSLATQFAAIARPFEEVRYGGVLGSGPRYEASLAEYNRLTVSAQQAAVALRNKESSQE